MALTADADLVPHHEKPLGWADVIYEKRFTVPVPRRHVWAWLQDPATFTRQVWPFRVEFVAGSGVGGASGMEPGVLNAHHGPLLNFSGVITAVDNGTDGHGASRDLHYCYGSYALGLRFIRPALLRFEVSDAADGDDATDVTLRVESFVRPGWSGVWTLAQRMFFAPFSGQMAKGARNRGRRSAA